MIYYPQYELLYKKDFNKVAEDYIEEETLKLYENYNLINFKEIMDFIKRNPSFIDFFKDITPIVKEFYPKETYQLKYGYDYEFPKEEYLLLEIRLDSKIDIKSELKKCSNFREKIRKYKFRYDLVDKFISGVL